MPVGREVVLEEGADRKQGMDKWGNSGFIGFMSPRGKEEKERDSFKQTRI